MLRAAAIALPRALLAGACYGGSLLARIAGKACSAYALRREWRAVIRALDDRMLRDIGLGRSGDRIRNLRQRSRERIALARISRHECQALFDRGEPRSAVGQSRRIDTAPAVAACPLRPSKRTSRACLDMSVKCQQPTWRLSFSPCQGLCDFACAVDEKLRERAERAILQGDDSVRQASHR